jgi:hypothetical protein
MDLAKHAANAVTVEDRAIHAVADASGRLGSCVGTHHRRATTRAAAARGSESGLPSAAHSQSRDQLGFESPIR